MVQFDNQYRQVKVKIVYYGPALGGKTTCLQHLHQVLDPNRRTRLYTLRTANDRTLFFDLLSLDLGRVRGYRLALQLFTVPGQVQYNATRRAVLAGADGVVFVADSQPDQREANRESRANLDENLASNGLPADRIPIVLQLNKRDLPGVMPRAEMEADLNASGSAAFETVATTGRGVLESLQAITELTVLSVADRLGLAGQQDALDRLVANVRSAFAAHSGHRGAPDDAPVVLEPSTAASSLREQELVAEAVRANMAMTELNARLDQVGRELETRVRQLRLLNEFGRLMSLAREPEEVTGGLLDRLLSELGVGSGALLLAGDDGRLVELQRRGLAREPMLADDGYGASGAATVLSSRVGLLVRSDEVDAFDEVSERWAPVLRAEGLASGLAVPLIAQDRAVGVVTAYADEHRGSFSEGDLELASVMAANAAVALANARAWRELELLNRSLEEAVAARTVELERALARSRELAAELEERNVLLEDVNRQLRDLERLKGDLLNRVAHELNTPVTAIQTASRILSRYEEVPPEKIARFAGIISNEAGRLSELIGSALQAAVLGVPDGAARAPVPLADLLRRVMATVKSEVAQRSLQVNVRVAAGLDHLEGDAQQIEAALRAVVKNAVEFNRDGGRLTIVVQPVRRGGHHAVEIRVEDSGTGIAAADLPHVHEVFWQGGNLLTDKPRGLGLGLAVARRVMENHGGGLDIVSLPDQGTTVTLTLPMLRAAPA